MRHRDLGLRVPADSEYRVEDRKVPVEGGEITVRTVVPTPAGAKDKKFPLLVWYHGGGTDLVPNAQALIYHPDLSLTLQDGPLAI